MSRSLKNVNLKIFWETATITFRKSGNKIGADVDIAIFMGAPRGKLYVFLTELNFLFC